MSQEQDTAARRRESQRRWREKNAEYDKARKRKWYYENRERNLSDPAYRGRRRETEQKWLGSNPERRKEHQRRYIAKQHGLELAEYDAILSRGCAVCGTHEGRMCLDHDHASGKVRDALCHSCNSGLGLMVDDPDRLRVAADYIEKHRKGTS